MRLVIREADVAGERAALVSMVQRHLKRGLVTDLINAAKGFVAKSSAAGWKRRIGDDEQLRQVAERSGSAS